MIIPKRHQPKDAYLLSAVLHGFDDDTSAQALRTVARAAAAQSARIMLLELVMTDHHADLASASFDMQMLMGTRGGVRSRSEWEKVLMRAGVQLEEIIHLASFGKMLVLRVATS